MQGVAGGTENDRRSILKTKKIEGGMHTPAKCALFVREYFSGQETYPQSKNST